MCKVKANWLPIKKCPNNLNWYFFEEDIQMANK